MDGPRVSLRKVVADMVTSRALFNGLPLALMEVMPAVGMQMMLLERFRAYFRRGVTDAKITIPEVRS